MVENMDKSIPENLLLENVKQKYIIFFWVSVIVSDNRNDVCFWNVVKKNMIALCRV